MTFERKVSHGGLPLAAAIAISVGVIALGEQGGRSPQAWAAVAAALAVLASIASAWGSQRVIELHENALEPAIRASFDFRSRYQLAQFRVANRGGLAAYDVRIEWDNPLRNADGQDVQIFGSSGVLPMLLPSDEASILLGRSHVFLSASPQTTWSGTLRYQSGSSRKSAPILRRITTRSPRR